ncbi:MAG: histidine ammonia-lyase [Alphaproteobacteria bacterium]|nr:histidine ammonia-lyase [Alphaproteobacteria bacterium]
MIEVGREPLSLEDVWAAARTAGAARLWPEGALRDRLARSAGLVDEVLAREGVIYGVTTGYGDSCTTEVRDQLIRQLPLNLTRFHGCGLGRFLDPDETRAVMAVRLASLTCGWSGVSVELAQLLGDMIANDILPLIPAEGSVGASGDLTPLSYIAGALAGEREVLFRGERMVSAAAFKLAGLKPIVLRPKEGLAIMNGTAVMTGLGALAWMRADNVSRLSSRLTAMALIALQGNPRHFDEPLFRAKPHPGQAEIARRIRDDLAAFDREHAPTRLQDRYSIRCAPHVIGVLEDMLPAFRKLLETEINSANDNPLIDPDTGEVLHGGHFYGGHICFAMDGLKTLVANVADLADRQLALMVDEKFNNGLPSNLTGATGERAPINHGFKAIQIAVSAWTAEALKLTMPASVFSRSTECHNQDKVSMGTIAARDAIRVLELTEQVLAAHTLACIQAIRLRERDGQLTRARVGKPIHDFIDALGDDAPMLTEDTPMDRVLANLSGKLGRREIAI